MAVRPVVAGVDGSSTSVAAAAHAAWQARRRELPLHIVACHGPGAAAKAQAQALVDEMVDRALVTAPDLDVSGQTVAGRAAPTLTALSADAALLVVGARGRGGFAGLLLGSVSQAVLHHAPCSVGIVRRAER